MTTWLRSCRAPVDASCIRKRKPSCRRARFRARHITRPNSACAQAEQIRSGELFLPPCLPATTHKRSRTVLVGANMRIAMIGLKALPPRYGGFETAADEIGRRLVKLGHEVIVYNRSGLSAHRGKKYEGIRLVTLPTIQTKNLSAIVHSFLSSVH